MGTLSGGGELWWRFGLPSYRSSRRHRPPRSSPSSFGAAESGFRFPLKPAATAASLALTGDTIAQVMARIKARSLSDQKDEIISILKRHDWARALRMASYGFLLYGPGSYAWYQFLDRSMPAPTFRNFSLKVLLNQIVLGPCVIAVVFAWNDLWQRKLTELPNRYRKDALPTLLYGFRFWIPVSILNFGIIPLQARVGFMSTCAIFWNFYLSSTVSK